MQLGDDSYTALRLYLKVVNRVDPKSSQNKEKNIFLVCVCLCEIQDVN